MASFKDREGAEWSVRLDAPTIEQVRDEHGINLANLESDPLIRLRNDPMTLVNVVQTICQDQIDAKGLEARQFAKLLPHPPDAMLDAVRGAIIDFFPSGRASHVREVLTKYEEMNETTDKMAIAKMKAMIKDPKIMRRLDGKADKLMAEALDEFLGTSSEPGT